MALFKTLPPSSAYVRGCLERARMEYVLAFIRVFGVAPTTSELPKSVRERIAEGGDCHEHRGRIPV